MCNSAGQTKQNMCFGFWFFELQKEAAGVSIRKSYRLCLGYIFCKSKGSYDWLLRLPGLNGC